MKRTIRNLFMPAFAIVGLVAALGACATTGRDRSLKVTASVQDVDREIRNVINQIDITAKSLQALVTPDSPDLVKAFDVYSKNLVNLENQGTIVLKREAEMNANSQNYFSEWQKQGDTYSNPQIRALSEERRVKLAKIYAEVPAADAGIKDAYLAYLANLKEIQKYLATDLTPSAILAIDPIAQKTIVRLDELRASLQPVIDALDAINKELMTTQ
jgi:hypothetical protein